MQTEGPRLACACTWHFPSPTCVLDREMALGSSPGGCNYTPKADDCWHLDWDRKQGSESRWRGHPRMPGSRGADKAKEGTARQGWLWLG